MRIALFILCSIASSVHAAAESAPLEQAVRRAPAVLAAQHRTEAALVRATSSGRWADPELEGMVARKETPMEDMPMWGASLQQPLPKWGERGAQRALARAQLDMARAEADQMAGDVAMEAARALAERDAARQRGELLTRVLERTERTLAAAEARLGAGQGRLGETLALQSRITELRLALDQEQRRGADADADARRTLGWPEDTPLPAYGAPAATDIDATRAPGLRLLEARMEEAGAMAAMARASARPMTAIRVSVEREEAEEGDEDTAGIALMTELPWNSRRYAKADVQAALAERAGLDAEAEALKRRIQADRARAERLETLAARTRTAVAETRQRIEREYASLVNASGSSGMTETSAILMLLELIDRDADLEMNRIEAETEAQMARAELWPYVPHLSGDAHE
jgi:cobalt-zinc-cadmium efflux system outer membrane protein